MFGNFGELLQDWHFLGLTFIGGLGISSFFAFLSTSSFVYIGHYGLTPTQYSMAFSINAIGVIGASQFAGFLALQLPFMSGSEAMGNHDSEIVDASSVD